MGGYSKNETFPILILKVLSPLALPLLVENVAFMSINIRWGQQTYSVSLPASKESPLTAAELSDALNWNEEQFLNLVITGAQQIEIVADVGFVCD